MSNIVTILHLSRIIKILIIDKLDKVYDRIIKLRLVLNQQLHLTLHMLHNVDRPIFWDPFANYLEDKWVTSTNMLGKPMDFMLCMRITSLTLEMRREQGCWTFMIWWSATLPSGKQPATWSPINNGRHTNQIDNITSGKQDRQKCVNTKSISGEECTTQHRQSAGRTQRNKPIWKKRYGNSRPNSHLITNDFLSRQN